MNAGSSAATNPNAAPKGLIASTPANTAMGALGGSISNLQERIVALREKLGPVLLPPRPAPETYLHVNGRYYGAGTLLRRKAENWHFLVLPKGDEAWTMFCTGEKKQTWGFLVDGLVKVPYRIYLQRRRERVAAAAEAKVFARGVDA